MTSEAWAAVLALIGLFSGVFGKALIERWFERRSTRDRQAADQAGKTAADNDQARMWLRAQLDESERSLGRVRESERTLLTRLGDLSSQVARLEERTNAQTTRIDDLSATVAKLGVDYADMKAERDEYRAQKHEVDNQLTAESLRAQLAERQVKELGHEIERLRGQLEAVTTKDAR